MGCRGGATRPAKITWTCVRCHGSCAEDVRLCAHPQCADTKHELTLRCTCDQRIRLAVPGPEWDGKEFQPVALELLPEIH